jgi:REP element-mobilizing transposase RayT
MAHFERSRLPHDVPNWIDATQEAFFITVNCQPRGKNQLAIRHVWDAILQTLEYRENRGDWKWLLILAMPDHLHGIVTFPQRYFLQKSMADWKRWLAAKHAISWQDGFFDHRLRTLESAAEKANYIRMNPVRAGLIEKPSDWLYIRDWKTKA